MRMIAGVMVVKDEVDIIGCNIEHHTAEGIECIAVLDGASTDGTRDALSGYQKTHGIIVIDQFEPGLDQPHCTSMLTERVRDCGAEWVIPIDADEFFYAVAAGSIAQALNAAPNDVNKTYVRMYQQVDLCRRWEGAKPLPKIAFRVAGQQPSFVWGNHDIHVLGEHNWDLLSLRELQYRSFDHFLQKIAKSRSLLPLLSGVPEAVQTHAHYLTGLNVEQIHQEWAHMQSQPTVEDPIPSKVPCLQP